MCFLPLKSSHYPSRPVTVPELFGKYPTRPVPKSKTPTRRSLDIGHAEITAKAVNEARIMNFYSCKLCLAKLAHNMTLLI